MYSFGVVLKHVTQPLTGLVELGVFLLRGLHVHNVDHVLVMLQMFVSLVLTVWGVDKREVGCLSSCVSFESRLVPALLL